MLRLLSSKAQGCNDFLKQFNSCYVGILRIAIAQYCQMNTHVPAFLSFFRFLHHFVLAKLTNSSIRVKKLKSECFDFLVNVFKNR